MSIGDLSRISTNVQSMSALGQLNKTNSELGVRQLRLATGSRLNRAEDDSAGYTIANKLQAKTRGQAQALSNIGDAKGMLTVGEGALNSTMDILQTMKEKAVQASNDTMGTDERAAIQSQIDALTSEIDDVLNGAEFNGTKLFAGQDEDGATDLALNFQVGAGSSDTFGVSVGALSTSTLGTATADADAAASVTTNLTGDHVSITDGTAYDGTSDFNYTFNVNDIDGTNFSITYEDANGDEQEAVASTDFSADVTFTVDGMEITVASAYAGGDGDSFVIGATAAVSEGDAASLSLDVTSLAGAQSAIDQIDSAIAKVNDSVSSLGDSQARLSIKQENLDTSMTNYEAARSRIEDTDFAKEQMEIVKLQILQQTGIASLAQANSAPQSVLSLIG